MIIYEVNLSISNNILDKFKKWLKNHIKSMLTFSGFEKSYIYNISSDDKNKTLLCIHYYVDSLDSLEGYFINYSEEMRKEGLDVFGSQFEASRRILYPCE